MQVQQLASLGKGHGWWHKSLKLTVNWEIIIVTECQDFDCANSWNWNLSPQILPYRQKIHLSLQKKHQRLQKGPPTKIIFITWAMRVVSFSVLLATSEHYIYFFFQLSMHQHKRGIFGCHWKTTKKMSTYPLWTSTIFSL